MLRRLYAWVLKLAERPGATWALAAVSFAESSFFPIPPDVMLIPMCLARRERAWLYAGICTVASVLGGIAGYAIGALLYDTIGKSIIELYGYRETAEQFRAGYAAWGHWIILLKGLTPIPKDHHDHVRLRRLRPVLVHRAVDHHAGRAVLYRGGAGLCVGTFGARLYREAAGVVRARVCRAVHLRVCRGGVVVLSPARQTKLIAELRAAPWQCRGRSFRPLRRRRATGR